jgi:hypothetical protein
MIETATHEQEVKELFEKLSVEVPGMQGLRAMNIESFKLAVDVMMNKAFVDGSTTALHTAEHIINKVFNT